MSWYAAHIVMYVEPIMACASWSVWENVILIRADSPQEAEAKATEHGKAHEDDEKLYWDGTPAKWVFAGIRKIVSCEDSADRPVDGTEITYVQLEFDSKDSINKFVGNEKILAMYDDN